MILIDTSVWIDHLRSGEPELLRLLNENKVLIHPWIIGELALGSIKKRNEFISLLVKLPVLSAAGTEDIMNGIEEYSLHSRWIGWVDAGIFISCIQYPCRIWTKDGKLNAVAAKRGLLFVPE
jgi:predicted nucleic acid-binding protein